MGVSYQHDLSSGWSLITRVIFHHSGLTSGWSFTGVVSHQGDLSSGGSLISVVIHQGDLSSGWSLIRVVSHQGVFHQGDLLSGWSLTRVVFHQGGLSSGNPLYKCLVEVFDSLSLIRELHSNRTNLTALTCGTDTLKAAQLLVADRCMLCVSEMLVPSSLISKVPLTVAALLTLK